MMLEVVCGLVMLYGLISGWRNGLIKELCSTFGIFAGLLVAWYFHDSVAGGGVIGFLILMVGVPVLLGFLASLLSSIISYMPLVGILNKVAGAVVGLLKFSFLMGCILLLGDRWDMHLF